MNPEPGPAVDVVVDAIRRSWSATTSASPDDWSPENAALGQCEVSSFVAWEYLGGDLVLSQVFVDGEFSEHHYWNRIDGIDVDISSSQFTGAETITEISVVEDQVLRTKQSELQPELVTRIDALRSAVADLIGTPT